MSILRPTADVGLIDLDRFEHEMVLPVGELSTDAMTQVPGGLLTDAEPARSLGTSHPFPAS